MRPDHAILIEIDDDFDPAGSIATGDDAADREYVKRHEAGELTAYGVSVVELNSGGNVISERYNGGSYGPVRLASLWGCDVETSCAEGVYTRLEDIPDDYLRDIAADVLSEVQPTTPPTD
jgi:hypothetical protein